MNAQLQRRIQRYGWDKASGRYEDLWSRQVEPAQARLLEMVNLQPGERVLDVACGTGLVSFPAAEVVGPVGSVVGTDISEEMVAVANREAIAHDLPHVSFNRMDADTLDFPDASFDAVLCSLGMMYFPDPVQSLREIRRVLKPGGLVGAAVWGARNRCGWANIFPIVDARVHTEVCPLFFALGTQDALKTAMETAGFTDVRLERLSTVLRYESGEEACGAAFAGGPVALAYSRFDEGTRREAEAEYLASIEPYREGLGYEIPGEFVIAVGCRDC